MSVVWSVQRLVARPARRPAFGRSRAEPLAARSPPGSSQHPGGASLFPSENRLAGTQLLIRRLHPEILVARARSRRLLLRSDFAPLKVRYVDQVPTRR